MNPGRKRTCRYLRRDGNRCPNEIAGIPDDEILLCPKHLLEAHQLFVAHLEHQRLRDAQRRERAS